VNVLRTARAVAWSFLGIRRGSGLEEDMKQLNPIHVILVALVGVLLLVVGLAMLVHWIV
jgi:sulfite exporter TauE/SafE